MYLHGVIKTKEFFSMGHTRDEITAVEDPFCSYPAVELALIMRSFEVLVFDINFTT